MNSTVQAAPVRTNGASTQPQPLNTELRPAKDLVNYMRKYARAKPDVAALWCFGVGIFVGWKMKPW